MRNLKKLLAVIITVAMLASMMVPALAADNQSDAEKLYDLGLLQGYADGDLALGDSLTREQGLTFMLRAMGLEEDVQAMSEEEVAEYMAMVVDAETVTDTWAYPYVAYAVKEGLTKGTDASVHPNIQFEGQNILTGKEFINFMLNAMGYDEGWDDVLTKSVEIGMLSAGDSVSIGTIEELTRDGAVGVIASSMGATNSEGITLAEALVQAGAVSEEAMIAAGYMEEPEEVEPEELTAEVSADNLIQLYVVFNQEVDKDSAEDEGNYDINKVGIADASLQDDGVTVVLTLDWEDARDQQAVVDLTIDGVKSLDEVEMDEVTIEDIEFIDTAIPTAVDAAVVGNDTFKVTFSEPIKGTDPDDDTDEISYLSKSDFVVNGGKSYIKRVKLQNNYTEALVEMYSNLKEGDVTLQVKSGSEDFAGFGVIGRTFDLEVVPDEEAPEVIGYEKAKQSEVTLIWNEDIEANGKINVQADSKDYEVYHTNSKNPAETVKIDGNKMKITFHKDYWLPAGTAYVYVDDETVRDLWDNENDQQMVQVEVEVDVTPPEIDKIEVDDEDQITVKFTEDVEEKSAKDDDNYTILDSDGDVVKNIIDDVIWNSGDKDQVVIIFEEDLNGDYSLVVEDVKDISGNKIDKVTVPFFVGDETPPDESKFTATLYNAGDEDQMLIVDFDDKMETEGKYSITDLEKYIIFDGTMQEYLENIDDVRINVIDDGEAVEIFIPSSKDVDKDTPEKGTDGYYNYIDLDETYSIQVGRLADAAGNKMPVMYKDIAIKISDSIAIDGDPKATARDTIKVTLKDKLADFDADDFVLSFSKTSVAKADQVTISDHDTEINDDGNTVVIFTIADADELDWDLDKEVYVHIVGQESENQYGKKLERTGDHTTDPITYNGKTVKDKIAPELYDDGASGDSKDVGDYLNYAVDNDPAAGTVTFAVYFTEDMKTTDYDLTLNYALAGSDFAIYYDNDDDALINGTDYKVIDISGNMVLIEVDVTKLVDAKDIKTGDVVTAKQYKDKADFEIELVSSPKYVTDLAGNKPDSEEFGTIDVEDVEFDCTKPVT